MKAAFLVKKVLKNEDFNDQSVNCVFACKPVFCIKNVKVCHLSKMAI